MRYVKLESTGGDVSEPFNRIPERLHEQRRRNQVMDVLTILAAGDRGVRQFGAEAFHAASLERSGGVEGWDRCTWQVFTAAEARLLTSVQKMLVISRDEAADLDTDELIASEWPRQISQVAAPALHVLNARGRYSEDVVEVDPSGAVIDLHDRRYAPRAVDEITEGTLVDTTVVCHHVFGLGVWVDGVDQFGHVNTPSIRDQPIRGIEDYPLIGERVRAVVLGYSGSQQLRLTTRHSDLPGSDRMRCRGS